ncbi:glycine oxidase ThiO [Luteipulveratus mongoliensis]|nr:glycine oxidase ThiO [Luteipulveratus mongoliensis]
MTVAVVGGGIAGLSAAWGLCRRGLDVVVYDDRATGRASPVAAGMLAPGSELDYGHDALHRLCEESLARWDRFADEISAASGIDIAPRPPGTLLVSIHPDDDDRLVRRAALLATQSVPAEMLSAAMCRQCEPELTNRARGCLRIPRDTSVDAPVVIRALRAALQDNGARIVTDRVLLARSGGRVIGVRRGDRLVPTDAVVLAAGVQSTSLAADVDETVPTRPVKGEILRLRTSDDLLTQTVRARVDEVDVYLVPRDDGEIVVGATSADVGHDTRRTPRAILDLLSAATTVLPQLRDAELLSHDVGLRPGTPDNGPYLGATEVDGLFVATGHYRHGFLLAPITADALAAAVLGEPLNPAAADFTLARHRSASHRRQTV